MIRVTFSGWFQCRLATDPDPHDERRGVSGYVQAYADEPDLDRIIHWQPPGFTRAESPPIGISVRSVSVDGQESAQHPLLGAQLSLLDDPKFEGRNGVIADDGEEPIYPFHLRVQASSGIRLQRAPVPADPDFPYREFFASGVQGGPDVAREIAAVTGIADLKEHWQQRLSSLKAHASEATGSKKVGLEERIAVLSRWLGVPRSPVGFFGVRMVYDYALRSAPAIQGWPKELSPRPAADAEWRAKFWLGGWDADALCGFCSGVLELPTAPASSDVSLVGARRDDRDDLMRGSR